MWGASGDQMGGSGDHVGPSVKQTGPLWTKEENSNLSFGFKRQQVGPGGTKWGPNGSPQLLGSPGLP